MKLIVGLGNPGPEYARTRHNIGFKVIEQLAEKIETNLHKKMFRALIGQAVWKGQKVILAQPQTYMNLSGIAVGQLINWYKLTPKDLLVICDDLHLEPGQLRLRKKGGDGGHNGLKSIIEQLGMNNFSRLRVGIGRPGEPGPEQVDFVLGKFTPAEQKVIAESVVRAAEAVEVFLTRGIEQAMNEFNRSRTEKPEGSTPN